MLAKVYWTQFIQSESTPPVQYQAEWTLESALHNKWHKPLHYILVLDHLFYRTLWRFCLWANSYESKKCISVRSLSFPVFIQRFKTKFSIFFKRCRLNVAVSPLGIYRNELWDQKWHFFYTFLAYLQIFMKMFTFYRPVQSHKLWPFIVITRIRKNHVDFF